MRNFHHIMQLGVKELMSLLRDAPYRFIVFCDDLSFDAGDASYKSLKAALEARSSRSVKTWNSSSAPRRSSSR